MALPLARGRHALVGAAREDGFRALAEKAPRRILPKLTQMLLRTTARRILDLGQLIDEMDDGIAEMLEQVFPGQVLTSMPGLGAVSTAAILAEIYDISRFPSKTDFVGYCSIYPIVWESGEAKRRYRMTIKGNRMLKMTLLVASAAARQYNPVIAAYYERLRARGKTTRAAGGAIARKLAEIIFTLLIRNETWSAEKAQSGLAKSLAMTESRPGCPLEGLQARKAEVPGAPDCLAEGPPAGPSAAGGGGAGGHEVDSKD